MWWALFEEIAPCAEDTACEKEMACCVRGYHVYKDTWAAAIGEVLVCNREPTNGENCRCKIIYCVKYFRTFSSYKNFFTTKIK